MIVVRLLTVCIIAGLLTGCTLSDDVAALKHDINVVKAYLRALDPPGSCGLPGTHQSRICFVKLTGVQPLKGGEEEGWYKGHVPKKVVEDGYKDCMEAKEKILKDFPGSSFTCKDPKDYSYAWYAFKLKKGEIPNPDKTVIYDFINMPDGPYLRLGTPEEAVVANP